MDVYAKIIAVPSDVVAKALFDSKYANEAEVVRNNLLPMAEYESIDLTEDTFDEYFKACEVDIDVVKITPMYFTGMKLWLQHKLQMISLYDLSSMSTVGMRKCVASVRAFQMLVRTTMSPDAETLFYVTRKDIING